MISFFNLVVVLTLKMKACVALCLLFVALASSSTYDEVHELLMREGDVYPRHIQFPDGDGNLHDVDLEAEIDEEILYEAEKAGERNEYWLYTRANRDEPQTLVFNDKESVKRSSFDPRKQTIVIAHGWMSNGRSEPNPTVRDAYLTKLDVNIITIDWRSAAINDYLRAVLAVAPVGRTVGRFINWLAEEFGLRHDNVHLVGFSLGAHLVGIAGRETGGRVARVTGLDPAGPLWSYNSNKLSDSDGVYVEAIHTDGGITAGGLGIGSDCAHVDFYPNGGVSQPGCITNTCNHNRAWQFFASTVTFDHLVGRRCSNGLQITLNTCRGENLNLGNDNLRKIGTRGSYRVNTARRYPY